jgi:hypothetical protein
MQTRQSAKPLSFENGSVVLNGRGRGGVLCRVRGLGLAFALLFAARVQAQAQDASPRPNPPVPDAPQPAQHTSSKAEPCRVKKQGAGGEAAQPFATVEAHPEASAGSNPGAQTEAQGGPCLPFMPIIDWYARFLDGPKVKPMTPKEKAWLAFRNVADPFNGLTILGSSAIAVAANSHSPYGPGMPGFGRYVGVSYSQNMTGEFIGTFLIPSIVHQDPHYHRMPTASIKRRIAHCFYQVEWTQGDNGKGMLNYADLVGFGIDDEIGNLYVPGRNTYGAATAERYGTALATAPIDNFVSEFLPDVARHLHIQIVVIQRIINQVANKDATNNAP